TPTEASSAQAFTRRRPSRTTSTATSPTSRSRPRIVTSPQPSSIPRLGVLWCPNWAVVAAGAAADEPVVVLHANRVIAQSLAAAREGIVVGQRRRQAQACCPDVRLVAHDLDADARRFA